MLINTKKMLTVTEANQNFSKATRLAEQNGSAVIFKNNRPRYMLVDLESNPLIDLTDDEKIEVVAHRVLDKYRSAFEELAK
jgi:antitoxin Phd